MKHGLCILIGLVAAITLQAQRWTTHFAYNHVTQIAMAPDRVYALSDGSLYSVEKQSEQIRVYNSRNGLHSTGISCIYYDEPSALLIIAYSTGKIDLLSDRGVQYIGELYDKDMTQLKTIYSITVSGRTAYLATAYGVQTFDMRDRKLQDSYWLGSHGQEQPISDIVIRDDSIYAFTADSLFCASLSGQLADYRYWRREQRTGRISPDPEKGTHYQDADSHWYAAQAEGIVRFTPTQRLAYKPQGPLVNIPYRISADAQGAYILPGGRWTTQNNTPGCIMHHDGTQWDNIPTDSLRSSDSDAVLDFMNIAVDPRDRHHWFVTSYGTGLYELQNGRLVHRYQASSDNTIGSAAPAVPSMYTRLDFALYDAQRTLWMLNAGKVNYQLVALDSAGNWRGLALRDKGVQVYLETPGGLLIDRLNPNHKWIAEAHAPIGLYRLDDRGTPFDPDDDEVVGRKQWYDAEGNLFKPEQVRSLMQDSQGRIWIGTEQGVVYFSASRFSESDTVVRPALTDDNGNDLLASQFIMALAEDSEGNILIGTSAQGVYVLSPEADRIVAHYTTDNSAMPDNGILSLACDGRGVLYIGTGGGLVTYDQQGTPEGLVGSAYDDDEEQDPGRMMNWRLHYSYANPQEIDASTDQVFALANGALFSVDRSDEQIRYWNKSTGLHGNTIAHIAYDGQTGQLLIGYEDGRIDLLADDGEVRQLPDLYMKAYTIAVGINGITVGSRAAYLAMPFGVLAVNMRRAEIADTYYIGAEASDVEVEQVVELGDSLYALTDDRIYSAAFADNLVDYAYWHRADLPSDGLQQAVAYHDELYILQHNRLYRRRGGAWQQAVDADIDRIHVSDGQLLAYRAGVGLHRLTDDDQLSGITGGYRVSDAMYTRGEYWLADETHGLVRLSAGGDDYFTPEGPVSNFGYRLFTAHDRLYVAPGGRWATQYGRQSSLSIYDGHEWTGIPWNDTYWRTGADMRDAVSYAIDPADPAHFFVATFGTGVFEFSQYHATANYTVGNSTLREAKASIDPTYFTRTDGTLWDADNNLWVLNATTEGAPLHIRSANGVWRAIPLYAGGLPIQFDTPGDILVDRRDSRYKWLVEQRVSPFVVMMYDGGTPLYTGDDRCVKRGTFVDQNSNTITPTAILSMAQDLDNRLWIGTTSGILLIPANVDFMTSNACRRIIIPRNDGTGLGDYLLGSEAIRCMAVDGGNRMWIGTESSGLYLIADDTITVAHFTAENSLLPSNTVQSIAIMPTTGEVFVGTDKGIASYRSDASAPQEDLKMAYAFPNPVRPNYGGAIGIAGLMENTVVNIVDAGGNLVCKTRSNGGMAVWSGYLPDGRRATSGVYTALCNEPNGAHTVVKILFVQH